MQENLNSTFQKDLTKFQNELKKRKDKLKKVDEIMNQDRERKGFQFIKYYKKREANKLNLSSMADQDNLNREKHITNIQQKLETASKLKLDSIKKSLERT